MSENLTQSLYEIYIEAYIKKNKVTREEAEKAITKMMEGKND